MNFVHDLKPRDVISNQELVKIFKCSNMGGMRRSHWTNTLILIADNTRTIYDDRWIDMNYII